MKRTQDSEFLNVSMGDGSLAGVLYILILIILNEALN